MNTDLPVSSNWNANSWVYRFRLVNSSGRIAALQVRNSVTGSFFDLSGRNGEGNAEGPHKVDLVAFIAKLAAGKDSPKLQSQSAQSPAALIAACELIGDQALKEVRSLLRSNSKATELLNRTVESVFSARAANRIVCPGLRFTSDVLFAAESATRPGANAAVQSRQEIQ